MRAQTLHRSSQRRFRRVPRAAEADKGADPQLTEELIRLAKEMREAQEHGKHLRLTEVEAAFCDALADN